MEKVALVRTAERRGSTLSSRSDGLVDEDACPGDSAVDGWRRERECDQADCADRQITRKEVYPQGLRFGTTKGDL